MYVPLVSQSLRLFCFIYHSELLLNFTFGDLQYMLVISGLNEGIWTENDLKSNIWADMKPGLKSYRLKALFVQLWVKSLAAVHSISARLQCKGTWIWHAS